jgi:hypothetical protein
MNQYGCRPPISTKLAISDARPYFGDDLLTAIGLEGIMNDEGYQQLLEQLKIEHRDLDDAINALTGQPIVDQLQIARLKKKKLALKDRIMRIEDQLVPDIIA